MYLYQHVLQHYFLYTHNKNIVVAANISILMDVSGTSL